MKHWRIAMLLTCLLAALCLPGLADMYLDQHAPEDWAQRGDIVRVTQVDTNRSDCLLIEAFGKTMLIDGGYSGYSDHVQAFLKGKGIMQLTWMLNTHPHDDHIDGTNVLLRNGWTAEAFLSPFAKNVNDVHQRGCVKALDRLGVPYIQVQDGYQILLGGPSTMPEKTWVLKEDLQPDYDLTLEMTIHTTGSRDFNDGSALLVLRYGESSMLFMADLTRGAQRTLMGMLPAEELQADIIKAPHHGITYFDNGFLELAAPQLVTIPNRQDKNNQIGSQCRGAGIPCLFSGEGDIVMETDGTDWYVWQNAQ